MIQLSYFGHSCFSLSDGQTTLLLDPFFSGNPLATIRAEDMDCDYILVSHGHADHLGDAPAIAQRTGAVVIATPETGRLCAPAEVHGMNIGGSHRFDFGRVRMTPALHSAGVPGGIACGFVIDFGDINIYFAGDTALFSDMQLNWPQRAHRLCIAADRRQLYDGH